MMTIDLLSTELREHGVFLLRNFFARDPLIRMKEAASRCFQSIETGSSVPKLYRFSQSSHSVILSSLLDFGCEREDDLLAPLSAPRLHPLFSLTMGDSWRC